MNHLPQAQGLYDPRMEHDACGVAFVADLHGRRSRDVVDRALTALVKLQHRGATNAEPTTGDGAGILIQIPDAYYRSLIPELPEFGHYATGMLFMPPDEDLALAAREAIVRTFAEQGLETIAFRPVPYDVGDLGEQAKELMPRFEQVFITSLLDNVGLDLDRQVYLARKRVEHEVPDKTGAELYFASLSSRTVVYKGMFTTPQLLSFFPELADERIESAIALVHSRFSTNTFPAWPLAHPYRFIAHNGEINTVMGNRNWMRAREGLLETDFWGSKLNHIFPICTPDASDTASLDEALELLHLGGYPIHHAMLMLMPEAWERNENMPPEIRAFYDFYASGMEAWDGPASVTFTDGEVVGAVLDRNGLRPSRYWVTSDGLVAMASEVGVIDVPSSQVVSKGRLEPGKMFLVNTSEGRIVDDEEIMASLAAEHPYQEWTSGLTELNDLPERPHQTPSHADLVAEQVTNGLTEEDLSVIVAPMALDGKENIGSMGTDTPLAVLSNKPRMLFDYFSQLFAQVTNPPLDAIREELVTSAEVRLGPQANILAPGPDWCRQLRLEHPVVTADELLRIEQANAEGAFPQFSSATISALYNVNEGERGLRYALDRIRSEAAAAAEDGVGILVITNRGATADRAPIPSLLAAGAIHQHLVKLKARTKLGIIVDGADVREVHHLALLLGFGANAICPSLIMETLEDRIRSGQLAIDLDLAASNYVEAATKGIIKVMSKMGISTVASYTGAQIFEAVGIGQEVVDEFFTGTTSKLGGIGLAQIAAECAARHQIAFPDRAELRAHRELPFGGEYQWRREGEYHLFNPETVFKLQHATRTKRYEVFKEYTNLVNAQAEHLATLRGLFTLKSNREAIPIDEVEPVSEIVKRFATGAMSYGSISAEAHETLAIAMNRLGGKSNTGEGGEDPERWIPDANGDSRRSSIKQVASGRFGVTAEYLTNSDDIQIKMAQGAKPGEGGQLPGKKVWPWIAKTRHSTPGVGLISPPPHHDIYSIEDLAQLIHDLKNSNPDARIHVKLVAEVGVGTVAAGVSKAKADVVLISGHDGGTGASPLTSLKHAGGPWELGLAETQQTLLLNDLRDRIVVQVDGQIKTGRDVVIAALLGGEEFGFATAPLVVSGCVMMRVCHLDTCPVGVATQNPELRAKFTGKPEFVETFFEYIAEEVRELLAELGFRSIEEAVGRVEVIDADRAVAHWKAAGLDLAPILHLPEIPTGAARLNAVGQDHGLDRALDRVIIDDAAAAVAEGTPVRLAYEISNENRTVGTMLGHELTKVHGGAGLPADTIQIDLDGSAGQSLGAFMPSGITIRLSGDANDYVGKGLSGGRIAIRPPADSPFAAEHNIIAGNVILYGATSGEVYLRGVVGERFCVRNSGATAVAEGVGDHGCEYMTGGRAVILGSTGRNFAAGMSGGIAYVFDADGSFPAKVNRELVDLEPLDRDDQAELKRIIEVHFGETGSTVAERVLAAWEREVERFVKVMPRDFKRVLEAMKQAESAGEDPVAAVMGASHG
ncbi:MAG: glutamate synthase large subunit [Acidimicrobiales bacterium]|nr:glutamate synthase large subunit [Acidimicrobiales bacterium]